MTSIVQEKRTLRHSTPSTQYVLQMLAFGIVPRIPGTHPERSGRSGTAVIVRTYRLSHKPMGGQKSVKFWVLVQP